MIVLQFLLLALLLFLLLRLANRALGLIPPGNMIRKVLMRIFPVVELVAWVGFAFWMAGSVFSPYPYYNVVMSAMVVALIAVLGWFLLRDFFAGMVFKTGNAFTPGQTLITPIASGTIRKLGLRCLVLEDDRGEKLHIPYSRLSEQILSSPPEEDTSHSHVIELHVPRTVKAQIVKNELFTEMVNMPWVIADNPPQVSVRVNNDEMFLVEVRFNVMKKEHALLVDENIKAFARNTYEKAE